MSMLVPRLLTVALWALFGLSTTFAQQAETPVDEDGSSQQTEQSDEAFRRSRELEDARNRDPSYVDNTYSQQAELEKIDKLPEESRDNIRDQLVDIIVEEGEWEPSDALKEYPYEPTAGAKKDPDLEQQEQEAWDEQIEKYHAREAAAWGAQRGPVPGPGNPTGQQGGEQGQEGGEQGSGEQGQEGGEQGGGQGGSGGDGSGSSGSAGTYQPYESGSSGSEDEESTAGVSESALDFLKGRQPPASAPGSQPQQAEGQQAAPTSPPGQEQEQGQEPQADPAQEAPSQAANEASDQQQESSQEASTELDMRGIIAIEDLDKLEDSVSDPDPDEEPPDP